MFTVIGDTIYYQGRAFASLTVTPVSAGGWVIDAREALEGSGFIEEEQVTEFRLGFRREINDVLQECLTKAIETFWLPEAFRDLLADQIGPALHKALDEEIKVAFRLIYKGDE